MDVSRFLNRPSTIHHRTESDDVDEYGDVVDGEPTSEDAPCYLAPWGTQHLPNVGEAAVSRATTSDEWLYVVNPGVSLASVDYITVEGLAGQFEVVGEADDAWNPLTAGSAYVAAKVRRTQR